MSRNEPCSLEYIHTGGVQSLDLLSIVVADIRFYDILRPFDNVVYPMNKQSTDRHKDHSRQYNVRIPTPLLESFNAVCKERGLMPAKVVRTLLQGFVDVAAEEVGRASS